MRFSVDVCWAVFSAVCFSLGAMTPVGLTMGQTVNHSPLYTFNGDSGDELGVSVSGAGDVNGDGFADLIVGASQDDNNGSSSGSARVFVGEGSAPEPLLGDVNTDGDVSFSDIPAFISVLLAGEFQIEADIDLNGAVNFADIGGFIAILQNQ